MFYSSIETAPDKDVGSSLIVVETVWWFVLWCVLEAFAIEGIIKWLRSAFYKTEHLFDSLDLDFIGYFFEFFGDITRNFSHLGNGDIFDWLGRGLILWLCTALPVLIWRGVRMEGRSRPGR